jgi:hypothetical protein
VCTELFPSSGCCTVQLLLGSGSTCHNILVSCFFLSVHLGKPILLKTGNILKKYTKVMKGMLIWIIKAVENRLTYMLTSRPHRTGKIIINCNKDG